MSTDYKQFIASIFQAIENQEFTIGETYKKDDGIYALGRFRINDEDILLYFVFDPVETVESNEYLSLQEYHTLTTKAIQEGLRAAMVYRFMLTDGTDDVNDLAYDYRELVTKVLGEQAFWVPSQGWDSIKLNDIMDVLDDNIIKTYRVDYFDGNLVGIVEHDRPFNGRTLCKGAWLRLVSLHITPPTGDNHVS